MARKQVGKAASGASDLMTRADVLALLATKHAKFTGTSSFGFSISLGQTQTSTLTVAPVVAGDALAAGEDISLQPTGPLPAGINIAFAYVSAANTVSIGFTSSSLVSLGTTSIVWRVTAHR